MTTKSADAGSYSYPDKSEITIPFNTAIGINNYVVTYVINQTITPFPLHPKNNLIITINDSKVYDGGPLVSGYTIATVTGLLPGDSLTAGEVTTKSADAGSYSYPDRSEITIPFNTAVGINNYVVTYVINQTIAPFPLHPN